MFEIRISTLKRAGVRLDGLTCRGGAYEINQLFVEIGDFQLMSYAQ